MDVSFWFVLWGLLAASLLFFSGWTILIATRQKKTWRAYAAKNKVRYKSAGLLTSPEISGVVDDRTISVFTSEFISDDERRTRKLTALEVQINSLLPADTGIASGEMVSIVNRLGIEGEYKPEHTTWKKEYIAGSSNVAMLEAYLNNARITALTDLMKTKNAWVICIFKGEASLLRIDLPDPLDKEGALEKMIDKMIDAVKVLELEHSEFEKLEAIKSKKRQAAPVLDVDSVSNAPVMFELEDDGGGENASEKNEVSIDKNVSEPAAAKPNPKKK